MSISTFQAMSVSLPSETMAPCWRARWSCWWEPAAAPKRATRHRQVGRSGRNCGVLCNVGGGGGSVIGHRGRTQRTRQQLKDFGEGCDDGNTTNGDGQLPMPD